MSMTEPHNSKCPDYWSHAQTVAMRICAEAEGAVLNAEQCARVDQETEVEYLACEGHR